METEKKVACERCGNAIPIGVFIASKRRNYSRGLCGKCQENAGLNVAFNRNGSISVQPGKEIFKSGE